MQLSLQALELAARSDASLAPGEIPDIRYAALHPEKRADRLLRGDELVLAHRCIVKAHLAAEKWKPNVMTLLADAAKSTSNCSRGQALAEESDLS